MKKILTASLVAMMAVTAANAKIASTKYVDDRTGTATFTADSIKDSANLTAAVETLAGTVAANAGAASDAANQALADAKLYTDALADGAVKTNTDAIAGMDLDSVGADGSYIKTVSQADGNVTAVAEAADTAPTAGSTKMVTSGGVYTALALKEDVANKATTDYDTGSITQYPSIKIAEDIANTAVSATRADISTLQTAVTTLNGGVDKEGSVAKAVNDAKLALEGELDATVETLEGKDAKIEATIGEVAAGKTVVGLIDEAKQAASSANSTLAGRVEANEGAIDAINHETTGILAVAKKYADDEDAKIEATIGDVAEGKTVVGLIDEAKQAASSANSTLTGRVEANEQAISTLNTEQDTQDSKISALETSLADGGATDARFDAVEQTANAAQVKSTADFQFGGANGTWKDITTLPDYCGKANATCSLVSKNGTIQWELVEY